MTENSSLVTERNRLIAFSLLIYVTGILAYSYYLYQSTYNSLMEQVDTKLHDAAIGAAYLLGDKLHANPLHEQSISSKQDAINRSLLSDYAQAMEVEYVYTFIKDRDQVRFTSSSATDEDIASDNLSPYFQIYEDATELDKKVFTQSTALYEESRDQWGYFRSILIPRTLPNGITYVTGADIRIDLIEHLVQQSILKSIITALFFLALFVPIILLHNQHSKKQLYIDNLTGLPNLLKLLDDLKDQPNPVLIEIDIDAFEEINNLYGIEFGDQVLKEFSLRIASVMPKDCVLYKLASDEYAILSKFSPDQVTLEQLISQISETPFIHDGNSIYLNVTAGIAQGKKHLLERADMALKKAKRERKSFVFYSYLLDSIENYNRNIQLMQTLKSALRDDRIDVHIQPVIEVVTGKIAKYECLMRIIDEKGHALLPSQFIAIAKRARLYPELIKRVFTKALDTFRQKTMEFSVNISISDILDPSIRRFILDSLRDFPNPKQIILEILESDGISDYEEAGYFINQLKAMGVKIAVDDLGTGYSNFEHILKLKVDYIKIDGSIIKNIPHSKTARVLAETLVDLAHKLEIKTVAEYVATQEIYDEIVKLGIDYAQGYHVGEPAHSEQQ